MIADFQFFVAYATVDVLCLVITVIISSNLSRDSGTERQVRLFFFLLTANLVFVVFDALWALLSISGYISNPSPLLLSFVNGMCVTSIAFTAYFWLRFTLECLENRITSNRWVNLAMAIPAIAVPVVHVIGHIAGQNVIFLPDGGLSYGIAHTLVTLVPLGYLVAATIVAVRKYRRSTSRSQRRTCLVFVLFMVAPMASGIFDMFIPSMPFAAAGVIVSLLFVMMRMQESRISSDALTGLNNRRRAEAFLETSMAHASVEQPLFFFIIDMDDFKTINDTCGHLEGDRALMLMSEALRTASARENAFCARWGGDEFIMICANPVTSDPADIAGFIQETLRQVADREQLKYRLACSVGYAVLRSASESRDQLIADADAMLFQVKQERQVGR
ncbi:MAG: GGDEF domain-containing protein [Eggerthellaceae bacterium]|nr:GGDEF domain-containing protein [Eggerthellaceae bacterium]